MRRAITILFLLIACTASAQRSDKPIDPLPIEADTTTVIVQKEAQPDDREKTISNIVTALIACGIGFMLVYVIKTQ